MISTNRHIVKHEVEAHFLPQPTDLGDINEQWNEWLRKGDCKRIVFIEQGETNGTYDLSFYEFLAEARNKLMPYKDARFAYIKFTVAMNMNINASDEYILTDKIVNLFDQAQTDYYFGHSEELDYHQCELFVFLAE